MKIYAILMVLLGIGFFGARFVLANEIKNYFGAKTYASLGAVLFMGFILHNGIMFTIIASLVLILTISSRKDAICRLVIFVIFVPNVDYFLTFGSMFLAQLSTVVGLSLVTLIACYARGGAQWSRNLSAEDALVMVLFVCFGIAASRGGNFSGQLRGAVTELMTLGLSYFVLRRFIRDRDEFAQVIGVLAGAAIILAFIAIWEAKSHWAIYDTMFSNQSSVGYISRNMKIRAGLLRAPASFSDSTAYAILAQIGVFAVLSSRRFFRTGLLWSGSILFTVLGLLAAQSRGADLGLFVGLILMVAVRGRYALAAAVAAGSATIVALLVAAASTSPKIASFIGADIHSGADQDYRQTLLRRGLQVGMEHPLLGDDMSRVIGKLSDIVQGEGLVDLVNSYLTIFLNSGLVGLSLVIVIVVLIFVKIFQKSKNSDRDESFIYSQMFIAGSFGGILLTLAFTSFNNERNPYWLLILLSGCRTLRVPRSQPSKSLLQDQLLGPAVLGRKDGDLQLPALSILRP